MTETQLINQVLEVSGKTEKELPRFRILGLVQSALELLAKRVCAQAGYEGLQTDFLVAPVAGRLDLSTIAGLLFDVDYVEVRVAATNAGIVMIDNIKTLEFGGLPKDQVFCAREGNEVVFRDLTGSLTAYTQAVKVKANQIPTLAGLNAKYNGAIVATVVELAGVKPAPAELTGVSV